MARLCLCLLVVLVDLLGRPWVVGEVALVLSEAGTGRDVGRPAFWARRLHGASADAVITFELQETRLERLTGRLATDFALQTVLPPSESNNNQSRGQYSAQS